MAVAILTNEIGHIKRFSDTIEIPFMKKDFSMKKLRRVPLDAVSARERLSIPFSYKWYKFKAKYLGIQK